MLAHSGASRLSTVYPEYGYNEKIDYPYLLQVEEMTGLEFIRKLYGIDKLPDHIAKLYEAQEDFHKETRQVLVNILGVTDKTVRGWGRTYNRMPTYYRFTLGLAYKYMCLQKEMHIQELSDSTDQQRSLRAV